MTKGYEQFFKKAKSNESQNRDSVSILLKALDHAPQDKVSIKKSGTPLLKETQVRAATSAMRNNKQKNKASKPIPKSIVFRFFIVIILFSGFAITEFLFHEEFLDLIGRLDVRWNTVSAAEEKPTEPANKSNVAAPDATPAVAEAAPRSPEYLIKLEARAKELDEKEAAIKKDEQEVQAQMVKVEDRLKELENTRAQIAKMLEDKVKIDEAKVENLVQVYTSMKPATAAKIFDEMDEGLATEILGRMKKKNAAEIMNLIKAEKAKSLTEYFAGYKRK